MSKTSKQIDSAEDRWRTIVTALEKETDRAGPLIAVEWLSDTLEGLLRTVFTEKKLDGKRQDRLLSGFAAPLASFAMRITICRAFGLLPPDMCDALDAMREIRNHCAHGQTVVSLQDAELTQPMRVVRDYVNAHRIGDDPLDARQAIFLGAGILQIMIEREINPIVFQATDILLDEDNTV